MRGTRLEELDRGQELVKQKKKKGDTRTKKKKKGKKKMGNCSLHYYLKVKCLTHKTLGSNVTTLAPVRDLSTVITTCVLQGQISYTVHWSLYFSFGAHPTHNSYLSTLSF